MFEKIGNNKKQRPQSNRTLKKMSDTYERQSKRSRFDPAPFDNSQDARKQEPDDYPPQSFDEYKVNLFLGIFTEDELKNALGPLYFRLFSKSRLLRNKRFFEEVEDGAHEVNPTKFRKIFVVGFLNNTTEDDLQGLFERYGDITNIHIVRQRCFGFITFRTFSAAARSLQEPRKQFQGRELTCKFAEEPGYEKKARETMDRPNHRESYRNDSKYPTYQEERPASHPHDFHGNGMIREDRESRTQETYGSPRRPEFGHRDGRRDSHMDEPGFSRNNSRHSRSYQREGFEQGPTERVLQDSRGSRFSQRDTRPYSEDRFDTDRAKEHRFSGEKGDADKFTEEQKLDFVLRRLYIAGLPWETTDDEIEQFFNKFGPVESAAMGKRTAASKATGYGFVTFKSKIDSMKCLNADEVDRIFKGKTLLLKLCEKNRARYGDLCHCRGNEEILRKVFIYKLGMDDISDGELEEFMGQYGDIQSISVKKDKDGKMKGFAFCTYFKAVSAMKALENLEKQFKGKTIFVKLASNGKQRSEGFNQRRAHGGFDKFNHYQERRR
eukprot:maker-scaffold_5-snap-gene-18.55-mRNA-1 protein AED:0.08 eAED:0.08 QI:154/1/1/1/0.66/0.25/4/202/550